MSALALVIAVVAGVLAWRANDQAGEARDRALAGRPGQASTGEPAPPQPPPGETGQPDPPPVDPTATGEPPPLTEQTIFRDKYTKQTIILTGRCAAGPMYADLDEPRANVAPTGADLLFRAGCAADPSRLLLGEGVEGSLSEQPVSTAYDCVERIRTAPLGEAPIPARKGSVVCVMTSLAAARDRGDLQRIVTVEIVAARHEAVTLQLSAWDVPR